MRKIIKRFVAYFIDLFVVVLISQSLSGIPFINKQLDTYNKYYDEYLDVVNTYGEFKSDLLKNYEDKKLTEKEYNKLIEKHDNYKDLLEDSYGDKKLDKKEYEKLNKKIDSEYNKKYRKLSYNMDKNSNCYFIIYLIVVFGYFVFFNKITNGQTLGKKLTGLKLVSNKDDGVVSIFSYVIRTILLYQPISYLIRLILVNILSMNNYCDVIMIVSDIERYLQMAIIITIMLRGDGRGLHDLIVGTKVISIDRNGNEVSDVNLKKEVAEKGKKNTKKIIEESNDD